MKQLGHFIKIDRQSKNFSLLDAEFIEQLAPTLGALPTEFRWRE
jgi:hypothetical protein